MHPLAYGVPSDLEARHNRTTTPPGRTRTRIPLLYGGPDGAGAEVFNRLGECTRSLTECPPIWRPGTTGRRHHPGGRGHAYLYCTEVRTAPGPRCLTVLGNAPARLRSALWDRLSKTLAKSMRPLPSRI